MQSPEEATLAAQLEGLEGAEDIIIDDGLEAPMEQPDPLQQQIPLEQVNLAEDMDEDELKDIAKKVIEDFEEDLESREEWEEKHAEWLKIYYQDDVAENPPWQGSSEESIPTLTEAVNQFQSRTYRANRESNNTC